MATVIQSPTYTHHMYASSMPLPALTQILWNAMYHLRKQNFSPPVQNWLQPVCVRKLCKIEQGNMKSESLHQSIRNASCSTVVKHMRKCWIN